MEIPIQAHSDSPEGDEHHDVTTTRQSAPVRSLADGQVSREYLSRARIVSGWLTRPEVAAILAQPYQPRPRQSVCVWFTGLSGSGKSTTAEILTRLLMEHDRQVTLLDGDAVRRTLSEDLGFSKQDRDINIRRIGFVASEVVRRGAVAVCAAVSPYEATRSEVRNLFEPGQFVEVFVDTPLDVCEQRDPKGLYALARRGELRGFTGIDDPYEPPRHAEITLDTVRHSAEENAYTLLQQLRAQLPASA